MEMQTNVHNLPFVKPADSGHSGVETYTSKKAANARIKDLKRTTRLPYKALG